MSELQSMRAKLTESGERGEMLEGQTDVISLVYFSYYMCVHTIRITLVSYLMYLTITACLVVSLGPLVRLRCMRTEFTESRERGES